MGVNLFDTVIFHIDINAFFASAETLRDPTIAHKPVVVCSNRRGSVVTTANYIARGFGITSAMPLSEAYKRCPDIVVTGVHFEFYDQLSDQFIQLMKSYSPIIEKASIDECYLDVSKPIKKYRKPLDLALEIKRAIKDEIGLDVSVGIAPNRFLAKMASDLKKPAGITIIRLEEISNKLWPLPIEKMHGVGSKSAVLCHQQGILTIKDLAHRKPYEIFNIFGKNSQVMIEKANGIDTSELMVDQEIKSLSISTTLTQATSDYQQISATLKQCCTELAQRCQEEQVLASMVICSIKDDGLQSSSRSIHLDQPSSDSEIFYQYALLLFDEHYEDVSVKLIGVGCSNFISLESLHQQISIFE